jgi:excisionase family DNA binding protein
VPTTIHRSGAAGGQPAHPLITVREAAALLRLSAMTIRRKVDAGQIPAIKCGSACRIPRAFIEGILRDALAGQTVVVEDYAPAADAGGAA